MTIAEGEGEGGERRLIDLLASPQVKSYAAVFGEMLAGHAVRGRPFMTSTLEGGGVLEEKSGQGLNFSQLRAQCLDHPCTNWLISKVKSCLKFENFNNLHLADLGNPISTSKPPPM